MNKKAYLKIITGILLVGLLCGTALAAPTVISSSPTNKTIDDKKVGEIQRFSVTLNEAANVTWNVGDDSTGTVKGTSVIKAKKLSKNESEFISVFPYPVEDTHKHFVRAMVENATPSSKDPRWTIRGLANDSVVDNKSGITDFSPEWDGNTKDIAVGETEDLEFNITTDQKASVEWKVNDETLQGPKDAKELEDGKYFSFYTLENPGKKAGTYKIKATATFKNEKTATKEWTLNVVSKYHSSGNRIWEEGMNKSYTWDYRSYSGFYYDINSGIGSETMTIKNIGRSIDKGDINYVTHPISTDFEHKKWGSYQVIGFMAERYFAGYNDNTTVEDESLDASLIGDGILSKVLTDSDDKKSFYSGSSLTLKEGYALKIVEVNVNGDSVWVQLEKDGKVVDDAFLASGSDYVYKTEIGGTEDVPIIIVHFGTVFSSRETSAAFVQGIFQISDNYQEIQSGDDFGKMEVSSFGSDEIKMKNSDSVSLSKGKTVDLMGKLQLVVADDDTLRFAPVVDTSEGGTYELRGTVYDKAVDKDKVPIWTPLNFEGFYYNIDEGIGTEELKVSDDGLDGREINDGDLVYTSTAQPVEFEHKAWGKYNVIGFMADKYFAGYIDDEDNGTTVSDDTLDTSVIGDGILAKVLIDDDDKKSVYMGSDLVLENGYNLKIVEVNVKGDTVWVQLEKDGKVVDEAFLSSKSDYVYKGDLDTLEDVPLIIVHFGTVFSGPETSAAFVEGIFQVSDKYTKIESGDSFGDMEVSDFGDGVIKMKNSDSISLSKDKTIDLMGNVKFKVADSDVLRFYPYVEVKSAGAGSKELKISVPDEVIVNETAKLNVTAGGNATEGVTVKVDGKTIGTTDKTGIVNYTPIKSGTFKASAEKDGYTTANVNIEVLEPREQMSIKTFPEDIYIGDKVTIGVTKALGGEPLEDVNVTINGKSLGKTDKSGNISYDAKEIGAYKVVATKKGFNNGEINMRVKALEAKFVFSELVVKPIEVKAGKDAEISVKVSNEGNAAGESNVTLKVNGNITDSQKISLGVGNNTSLIFKHKEEVPGNYTVEIGDQSSTYTVTKKTSVLVYALALLILIGGGAAYMFAKGNLNAEKIKDSLKSLKPQK